MALRGLSGANLRQLASLLGGVCPSQPTLGALSRVIPDLSLARNLASTSSCLSEPSPKQGDQTKAEPRGQQGSPEQAGESQQAAGDASSSGSSSSAGPSAEDVKEKMKAGFSSFRDSVGKTDFVRGVAQEVRNVFSSGTNIRSATRRYTGPVANPSDYEGPAALMLVQQQQTAWQRFREQVTSFPMFAGLKKVNLEDTAAYKRAQELVADLKDKYENSDHPMVHRAEEVKEKLMSGTESGRTLREIRVRDPSFDMNNFLRSVKLDAPVVTQAFLKHDMPTLELHCGPELLERFRGIFKHFEEQGNFTDPTILFVGDVEVVEIRESEGDPFVIIQFHCQQLKCNRDKFGNVIEGSMDSIQRVYYFWGLQQETAGVVTDQGELLPPRWVIKDMMWHSLLALI